VTIQPIPLTGPYPGAAPQNIDRVVLVLDGFRVGALAYAVAIHLPAQDEYRHPLLAWGVLGLLAVWTAVLLLAYPARRGRPVWTLGADLALAAAAVLSTRWVDDPARIADGALTLPSFYVAAAVLSWAVRWEWRGGLAASLVVATADLIEVRRPNGGTVSNIVLMILGGLVVGYASELIRSGREQLAAAVAQRPATAERERLARDIHDSVLQVLGFVHRQGAGAPGPAGELAQLAGEQEARLRALIASGPVPEPAVAGVADLRAELVRHANDQVTVSAPADPVLLPATAVAALAGATGEALGNVRTHAGPGARAWVLVEDEPDAVTVTVRDDGAGFAPGRLDAARAQGRLGVQMSICGRIEEAGGRVSITGQPGEGTEVEMRVPR
jgi:signal transduction histidine kinase